MNSKNQCLRVLLSLFLLADFSASANMIGSDAQNFSPTQDGLDFVTVHSSETLDPGILNLGFFVNYAQNTFPAYEGGGPAQTKVFLTKMIPLQVQISILLSASPRTSKWA